MDSSAIKTEIAPHVMIYLALAVIFLPLRWLVAMAIASAVHEAGHLIMLKMLKIPVRKIGIGLSGAEIHISALSYGQELLCACAGPLAGTMLIGCGSIFPELAICAFAQSIYNMLPVMPYDGGRILRSFTMMFFQPNTALAIQRGVQWLLYVSVIGITLLLIVKRLYDLLVIMFCWIVLQLINRKIACKAGPAAVQ